MDPLVLRTDNERTLVELQRITDAALAHLSSEDLLAELLDRIADILRTDTAAILLLDETENVLVARAAKGIEEEVEEGVRIPVGRGFAGRIAAQRLALTIPDIDHADILNPILRRKGIRSLLGVPLLVEGRMLGVLHVGTLTPRAFTDADRELLQIAADRAALAIDHAILFERERHARREAERAAGVLRAVQRVTDAALTSLSLDELLDELLHRIADVLRTDTAAILLLDETENTLVARAAKGIEEEVEQGVRIPVGLGFAGRIAAERRAVAIADVDHADILNPILRQKGIRSLLGVPLVVEGRMLGVLHVGTLTPRAFTDADEELLQIAADRAALAIEHAHAYEQRRVADALQRALLPPQIAEIPGLDVAVRYLSAAEGTSLGGDWYDVFRLESGLIGLAVGDVVGHGIPAAALMAQLRTGLRAYAVDGHDPASVMARVSRLLRYLRPETVTTATYITLDPGAESLTLVSAGHPPPLVVARDGAAQFLPVEPDLPLGVDARTTYREQRFALPAGACLVLFTDGVVEVRGEPIDIGLERLRRLAESTGPDVERLCRAALQSLVPDGRPRDDVALLAVRPVPFDEHLVTRWPAETRSLAGLRGVLRPWLRHHGADEDEIYDITVACQEAAANASEHAYAPGPNEFEVHAKRDGGDVVVVVRDRGGWRPPRGKHRGRGLTLMRALMHDVDVQTDTTGTTVTLRRTLGRRT